MIFLEMRTDELVIKNLNNSILVLIIERTAVSGFQNQIQSKNRLFRAIEIWKHKKWLYQEPYKHKSLEEELPAFIASALSRDSEQYQLSEWFDIW